MSSKVIVFCMLSALGGTSAVLEDSPASHSQHLNPMANSLSFEVPSEKRAYTYVSEYKRLPVYNFGIGKRWIDSSEDKRGRPYSFGLGKRTKSYGFGLGKRNDNQEYHPVRMSPDYVPVDSMENYHSREDGLEDFLEDKRSSRPYSFGLGKRGWNVPAVESIGTGKRPNEVVGQRYLFGVGKRMAEEDSLQ